MKAPPNNFQNPFPVVYSIRYYAAANEKISVKISYCGDQKNVANVGMKSTRNTTYSSSYLDPKLSDCFNPK